MDQIQYRLPRSLMRKNIVSSPLQRLRYRFLAISSFYLLSCPNPPGNHWLQRIPKRHHVTGILRKRQGEMTMSSTDIRWGIQILQRPETTLLDLPLRWVLSSATLLVIAVSIFYLAQSDLSMDSKFSSLSVLISTLTALMALPTLRATRTERFLRSHD